MFPTTNGDYGHKNHADKEPFFMKESELESTNRLLRVIIALMVRGKEEQLSTLRKQVEVLNDLGLKPAEIAKILCRSNTYVSKELVGIRKGRK